MHEHRVGEGDHPCASPYVYTELCYRCTAHSAAVTLCGRPLSRCAAQTLSKAVQKGASL